MLSRKQKLEELLESFGSLRRMMAFRGTDYATVPRITPSQWGVIMLVQQRGESSVKDIARTLHVSSSAATQLVDGLVKSGYVAREEHAKDRRAVVLTLSKKTKNQVVKMKKRMIQKFLQVFKVLTEKEFNQYYALHKKIVQRFSNK